jgi:hypothetical protein
MRMPPLPVELQAIREEIDANEKEARSLVEGLDDAAGRWRPAPDSWSVSECLEHLALTNRLYLSAMLEAATEARQAGRSRVRPARPGVIGRQFVRMLEPPVKKSLRARSIPSVTPSPAPAITDAYAAFLASHPPIRAFLQAYADIDLAGIRFRNPFVRAVRFSLATGLHAIPAHERRHLWQAWTVRRAAAAALV